MANYTPFPVGTQGIFRDFSFLLQLFITEKRENEIRLFMKPLRRYAFRRRPREGERTAFDRGKGTAACGMDHALLLRSSLVFPGEDRYNSGRIPEQEQGEGTGK